MISELTVERLAHTGEGIATHEGRTVLVRGALPGEVVRAELTTARVARGRVIEVIRASESRVEPPCPHVDRCGGCDLMHASQPLQRAAWRDAVLSQLRRARSDVPDPVVHAPCPPLGYRARARLSIHAQRGGVRVGFHRPRSHKMAAVDSCAVLRPELAPAIDELTRLIRGSSGKGEALVALGRDGICVDLRWEGTLAPEVFARADGALAAKALAGVQIWEGRATTPARFGDVRAQVTGSDGSPLAIAPGGFAQASDEGGRFLAQRVGELAAQRPGGLTIELFAGSGTLTIAARPFAERYIAVERDEVAARTLGDNLADRDMTAKIITADADTYALRRPLATVILDPPRSGAAGACRNIAAARPKQVIYVSCNPATLARDLETFSDYRLAQLELVELFPQTSHIETIARLTR